MNQLAAAVTQEHMLLTGETPELLAQSGSARGSHRRTTLDWRQAAGIALCVIGILVMCIGWYGLSGTNRTSEQLSYFLSGGIGGAAVLACGLALLISFEHVSDREAMARIVERLDRLEYGLASEFDDLRSDLSQLASRNARG